MSSVDFPRIQRLSASLASQIAAGEVIERPASVIKELVENSLDAGADRIDVEVEAGGTRLIRVRDNGHGIHPDDMALALESHATSKLRTAADLEAIRSLGFRGEALASIASVSRFRLTSCLAGAEQAWTLALEPGGTPAAPEPAAHRRGTSVEVCDLFQALPARRKFLRTERTEFLHILETVRRLALCRFDVDIRLQHNRRRVLHCRPAAQDPDRRLQDILGGAFVREAMALDSGSGGMRLWGRLGGAGQARNQSDRQYFYLNGRMIRDKRVNHAVRKALEGSIPPGRYPSYVLHLEVEAAGADVNVHPTKQEVRFRRARDVHDFIHAAVRETLHRAGGGQAALTEAPGGAARQAGWPLREPAGLYRPNPAAHARPAGADRRPPEAAPLTLGRFLLLPDTDGLLLVDFTAARERLLERQLQQGAETGELRRRPLLVPVLLEVAQDELDAAERGGPLLQRFGLELAPAGPASLRVCSLPALLEQADVQALCRDVLAVLAREGGSPEQRLTAVLARHGAAGAPPPETAGAARTLLGRLEELSPEAMTGVTRHLDEAQLRQWLGRNER